SGWGKARAGPRALCRRKPKPAFPFLAPPRRAGHCVIKVALVLLATTSEITCGCYVLLCIAVPLLSSRRIVPFGFGWPPSVEQIRLAFLLCVGGVFDLEPPHARVVGIVQPLRDNPFEVVRAHQLEELAASADDRQRHGDGCRSFWQDALQALPALAE